MFIREYERKEFVYRVFDDIHYVTNPLPVPKNVA